MILRILVALLCCGATNGAFLFVEKKSTSSSSVGLACSKWATCPPFTSCNLIRNRLPTKLYQQRRKTLQTTTITTKQGQQRKRTWEETYQLLLKFKEENGHCDVPYTYTQDPRLGVWVNNQRKANKEGMLKEEKRAKLENLGFSWNRREDSWKKNYQKLMEYREIHGDCNVPWNWSNDASLCTWVRNQRFRADSLSYEQRSQLDRIGFSWNLTRPWGELYQELADYREEYGDCNVPQRFSLNPALGEWVAMQRQRKALLSAEKRAKLDAIKFTWEDSLKELNDKKWHGMFDKLKWYRQKHGHCRVPGEWSKDPSLGRWVRTQRKRYRNGNLSKYYQRKLDEIGFVWRLRSATLSGKTDENRHQQWLDKYEAVKVFQDEHGHFNIPRSYNLTLGTWVTEQRRRYRQLCLEEDRRVLLEEIGFEWSVREKLLDEQWQNYYDEIQASVTGSSPFVLKSRKLRFWAYRQRVAYANGRLQPKRQRLLEDIGFVLEPGGPYFTS